MAVAAAREPYSTKKSSDMKLHLALIILPFAVAACASPPQYDFVKEGATPYQRTDARSECQYQIRLNKTPGHEQEELLKLCMQGKGYRWRQVG